MGRKNREAMRVVVLAGGISDEREISQASGANVATALTEAGYGVVDMMDPADENFLSELSQGEYDAAFIALHGLGGEDGMIQSVLEYLHIPYTGSGVTASACAADKDISKVLYEHAGIPIAKGVVVERGDAVDADELAEQLGGEMFVKPAVNGSSYGVSCVKSPSELDGALEVAFEHGDKALVEQRLVGTEITVGVYEGEELVALPVVEIRKQEGSEFYDLNVKYIDPKLVHRIPAQLDPNDYARAQELACAAHRALGCSGFSRSDFIVTHDGPVILETNTIPGMTDTSLYPDEVRHAGMKFSEVCDRLVELALERAADK
ncbi:D-alanine--D-alanine ligase family protein [Enorma phocaeensis]|uniref:D-alanine--D-alanine ligase n=1 Tax=Enorma phocaeensis TaxID=1871019 RepID=A0ABT7V9U0_9ACTN|nr:D-alanine--D-alanine ligase [Enorma phocaeensis]MDM8275270.1 D-alanine--D-alanine ligase [Enorma phocaeensis]